jgi:hypothetical protein
MVERILEKFIEMGCSVKLIPHKKGVVCEITRENFIGEIKAIGKDAKWALEEAIQIAAKASLREIFGEVEQ